MAETAVSRGFVAPVPRLPCAADIPWPSVIRSSKLIGMPIERTQMLLLRGATEDTLAKLKSKKNGTLWQEDWVKTWGWWALEPGWNTEFNFRYPIRAIVGIAIHPKSKFRWTQFGKSDRILPPLTQPHRPLGQDFYHMIKGLIYISLYRIHPNFIRFLRSLTRSRRT